MTDKTNSIVAKIGNYGVMCSIQNDQVLMHAPDNKLLAIGEVRGPTTIIFLQDIYDICIKNAEGDDVTEAALKEMIENTAAMLNDPGKFPVTLWNHTQRNAHDANKYATGMFSFDENLKLMPDTPYLKQVQKALGYNS